MSLTYLTIDAVLIEQLGVLDHVEKEERMVVIEYGLMLLEGRDISDGVLSLEEKLAKDGGGGINANILSKLCAASSTLLWECAKCNPKDQSILTASLIQLGLSEEVIFAVCQVYYGNKRRMLLLRGSLGISALSYQNLVWRLDVELARRNSHVLSNPKYLLRLDLVNHSISPPNITTSSTGNNNNDNDNNNSNSISSDSSGRYVSHHLQCDFGNLKLLETELQRAVDEVNHVHSQRICRYIS
mmetsp:Transcript_28131/g.47311  ORF Transcript_28131/g.47311 Transcript_28131/m.47311 type:complete len:242 (-) Transcript_28131:30-755(-)